MITNTGEVYLSFVYVSPGVAFNVPPVMKHSAREPRNQGRVTTKAHGNSGSNGIGVLTHPGQAAGGLMSRVFRNNGC